MSYTHLVAYQNVIGLACYATNLVQIHLQNSKVTANLTVMQHFTKGKVYFSRPLFFNVVFSQYFFMQKNKFFDSKYGSWKLCKTNKNILAKGFREEFISE